MAGEANIHELDELDRLLEEQEEWKKLAAGLADGPFPETSQDQVSAEAAFAAQLVKMQVSGRLGEDAGQQSRPALVIGRQPIWRPGRLLKIAAIFLAPLGCLYLYFVFKGTNKTVASNEIITKKGSTSQVKLPDGTSVWLNSDSRLVYSKDFGTVNREVKLTGEAFFDVVHDDHKPFIIHTDKIDITDLGTTFNVKAYEKDPTVETVLVKGSIEVTFHDSPAEKIILKPNEKLVVRKDRAQTYGPSKDDGMPKIKLNNIHLLDDSTVAETAWIRNRLVFDNQRLSDIVHLLERRFDVEVEIRDSALAAAPYTGDYEQETLTQILTYMSLSKPFQYAIQGKKVIIQK
jgi:ferric-dicitrate binding protein FerR (iron transport regulator)